MCLRGIKLDAVPHEQWPQRDADHSKQQPERKEDSKRLCNAKRRRFPVIHCDSSVCGRTITAHAKNGRPKRCLADVQRGLETPLCPVSQSEATGETAQ